MKILCISSFFREEGGGVAHMAHLLAQELAGMPGNEVTLAAHIGDLFRDDRAPEAYRRLPIRATNWFESRLGVPLLLPHPSDVNSLKKAAREADLLIVHDSVYLANLAAISHAHRQTPTIVVKHTGRVRFGNPIGRLAFSVFDKVLTPHVLAKADALAFVTKAKLENAPPVEGPIATVIPNGIDTGLFVPRSGNRNGFLLFVGRFVAKKGIGIIREMARIMPEKHFVVAGYGTDDPRAWKLDNVTCHWRPGPEKLAELYSTCRAVILPGETEGTPLVALEALACTAPVVIGKEGASPDPALAAQMATLRVDVENERQTAKIWCDGLDAAIQSSRPDRSVIEREYGAGRMARDYMELVADIMAKRSAGHD